MEISVIIPVYNIATYLENTLNSLLKQTYKDFEVILIDDGSTDRSVEICNIFSEKYSFIRVVHKTNGGVSSARNYGLNIAKGKWVFFLDGDDILCENAFSILMQAAQRTQCDIVEGNYIRILNNKKVYSPIAKVSYYEEDSCSCIRNTLIYNRNLIYPRLFKRQIIGKCRFRENIIIGEDILFVTELFLNKSIRLVHCKDIIYHYIQRSGSAMHSSKTMIHYDTLSKEMTKMIGNNELYKDYLILFCCINLYFKAIKSKQGISKEDYNSFFKGRNKIFWNNTLLAIKFKVLFRTYGISRNMGNFLLSLRSILFPKF